MKSVFQILLGAIIIMLAYFMYKSIMEPIEFGREKDKRYGATIQRLKMVRTAQEAYFSVNANYTDSFDTLITFLKKGQFKVVRQMGYCDDSLALESRGFKRDTIIINVCDSLFKNYPVDSLRFVPFSGGVEFELATDEIETGSRIMVKVFECKAHNNVILKGLNRQEIINMNDLQHQLERYPGLQVGSVLETTNNAGNWE